MRVCVYIYICVFLLLYYIFGRQILDSITLQAAFAKKGYNRSHARTHDVSKQRELFNVRGLPIDFYFNGLFRNPLSCFPMKTSVCFGSLGDEGQLLDKK